MSTTWQPAVIIRFTGPRFDEPASASDFDIAAELAAYKTLLVKTAEALWRTRHPGRARLPRGFSDGVHLRFREVHGGRFVTVLERSREEEGRQQLLMPMTGAVVEDDIDHAICLLLDVIQSASRGEPLPELFPREVLPLFGAWGNQLGLDEQCELSRPGASAPVARYGQSERVALMRFIEGEGLDVTEQIGYVPSIGRGSFELYTDVESGDAIDVPLRPEHEPLVREAAREYARVRVWGLGLFDASGKLTRFVEVDGLDLGTDSPVWGGAEALWDDMPALSKCRPEDRVRDTHGGAPENLNAYVYGIGR